MSVQIDPEIYSQAIYILTLKCKRLYAQNKFLKEKIAELEKKRDTAANCLSPRKPKCR